MGSEEGAVKRARQNALIRRQVAERAIASHGGSKRHVMALLSPRPVGALSARASIEQAKTERPVLAPHQPSALSARGREVIQGHRDADPTRVDKVDSTMSPLPTRQSLISNSTEPRPKGALEQSILPRGSLQPLPRGSLLPRGSMAVAINHQRPARPEWNAGTTDRSDQLESDQGGQKALTATKNRMTFVAFRQTHKVSPEVMPLVPPLKIKEPEEERVKRLMKRFAFSEEEVRRVMGYYKSALRYGDLEDVEAEPALPVQGLKNWLCQFSGIDENQPLGHLLDPEWSKETCLSEDEFLAWYNSRQWSEEIMVPDPLERRVRHFCKKQGYHISDVERVKAAFEKADRDSSGLLDQQEFAACYAGLVGVDPCEVVESRFRILWEEVDEDHNGTIDLLEFAKWYLRVNPPGKGK